jgi:hypothetical protein
VRPVGASRPGALGPPATDDLDDHRHQGQRHDAEHERLDVVAGATLTSGLFLVTILAGVAYLSVTKRDQLPRSTPTRRCFPGGPLSWFRHRCGLGRHPAGRRFT